MNSLPVQRPEHEQMKSSTGVHALVVHLHILTEECATVEGQPPVEYTKSRFGNVTTQIMTHVRNVCTRKESWNLSCIYTTPGIEHFLGALLDLSPCIDFSLDRPPESRPSQIFKSFCLLNSTEQHRTYAEHQASSCEACISPMSILQARSTLCRCGGNISAPD